MANQVNRRSVSSSSIIIFKNLTWNLIGSDQAVREAWGQESTQELEASGKNFLL